jgi:cysteinyl-tRNA synthetase
MLLGDEIDIHSGGEDNIFPHHECEVAQSCCATGRPIFARVWFHTRFLQVEGAKMSKSKGNFFTPRDLFAKGVTPAALRLELVRTHYRSNANFTMQGIQDCQRMVDRWSRAHTHLLERTRSSAASVTKLALDESRKHGPFELALVEFTTALCDDLNVARAIASLNAAVNAKPDSLSTSCPQRELSSLLAMDSVLDVLGRNAVVSYVAPTADPDFVARVESLLAARTASRAAKDWAESDRVRAELNTLGIAVKDGPDGATWSQVH